MHPTWLLLLGLVPLSGATFHSFGSKLAHKALHEQSPKHADAGMHKKKLEIMRQKRMKEKMKARDSGERRLSTLSSSSSSISYLEEGDMGDTYKIKLARDLDDEPDSYMDDLGLTPSDMSMVWDSPQGDASAQVDLGLDFTFFNGSYSTGCVGTNGYITFCDDECPDYSWSNFDMQTYVPPDEMPQGDDYDGALFSLPTIAMLWTDLWTQNDNTDQYNNIKGNVTYWSGEHWGFKYFLLRYSNVSYYGTLQEDTHYTWELLLNCTTDSPPTCDFGMRHFEFHSIYTVNEGLGVSSAYLDYLDPVGLVAFQDANRAGGGMWEVEQTGKHEIYVEMISEPEALRDCDDIDLLYNAYGPLTTTTETSTPTPLPTEEEYSYDYSITTESDEGDYAIVGDTVGDYYTVARAVTWRDEVPASFQERLGVDSEDVITLWDYDVDDGGWSVDIGFDFTFFDKTYTSLCVNTNGIVTFCDAECADGYWNTMGWATYNSVADFPAEDEGFTLPSIALGWSDLYLPYSDGGSISYFSGMADDSSYVFGIVFDSVRHLYGDSSYSMELLLNCTADATTTTTSATSGSGGVNTCGFSILHRNNTPYSSQDLVTGFQDDGGGEGSTFNFPDDGLHEVYVAMTTTPDEPEACDVTSSSTVDESDYADFAAWNFTLTNSNSSKCLIYMLKMCMEIEGKTWCETGDERTYLPPGKGGQMFSDWPNADISFWFGSTNDSSIAGKEYTVMYTQGEEDEDDGLIKSSLVVFSMDGALEAEFETFTDQNAMQAAYYLTISSADGVDCGVTAAEYTDWTGTSSYYSDDDDYENDDDGYVVSDPPAAYDDDSTSGTSSGPNWYGAVSTWPSSWPTSFIPSWAT